MPTVVKYNLLSSTPPQMPKRLPGLIKTAIQPVPDHMKQAAASEMFSPVSANMKNVFFTYNDNKQHEPAVMSGTVASSATGKSFLDEMNEALIVHLRKHDEESRKKLERWAEEYKRKGGNQDKPERPKDAAILVPEPDMTNPAFIQLLKDAEREDNSAIYCEIPELEMLNQVCGSHRKVTNVIRLNFDTKPYGAQRATPDGISGNPRLRWRFTFSTTEQRALEFFKDGLMDGTLGRISIGYVMRDPKAKRGIPKQGRYDQEYFDRLEPYIERLRNAHGHIHVPRISKLIKELVEEMADVADLAEDEVFQSLANRSLVLSWLKGCILYVAEGYRMSNEILEFVRYSLYYDLWSKIALFAPQWRQASQKVIIEPGKYGPANMLDRLPVSFAREQLERLREDLGKPKDGINQLTTWVARGYVTYDEQTQLYSKTEAYLAKHPQPDVKA